MRRGLSSSNKQRILFSWSFHPSDNPLEVANEFLPAVFCTLVVGAFFRREAGLLHAKMRAALPWSQRPDNNGAKPQSTPAIREPCIGFYFQNFTIDDPVPIRRGHGAKLEPVTHDWLKIILH